MVVYPDLYRATVQSASIRGTNGRARHGLRTARWSRCDDPMGGICRGRSGPRRRACRLTSMMRLLGGPPRSGKTLIAQRMARTYGIGWLSTDTVKFLLRDHWPEGATPKFGEPPDAWCDAIYPAIRDAVDSQNYMAEDYLIEGGDFLPRHAARLREEFPELLVCFVGLSTDLDTINAYAGRTPWHLESLTPTGAGPPTVLDREIQRISQAGVFSAGVPLRRPDG